VGNKKKKCGSVVGPTAKTGSVLIVVELFTTPERIPLIEQ
jgi:hypothetical protein